MDTTNIWRQLFAAWPDALPQRGVIVTSFNEQVNFVKFLLSEHFLMVERMAPDTVGGRRLLIPYGKIEAVKITDPVTEEVFLKAGYLPGGRALGGKPTPQAERGT
jgi:hypothetical protein